MIVNKGSIVFLICIILAVLISGQSIFCAAAEAEGKGNAACAAKSYLEYPRAIWVWHSLEMMLKEDKRQELFEFCNEHNVDELFFQLHYVFEGAPAEPVCRLKYADKLRDFIAGASDHGIKVNALDGFPEFALKSWHPKMLALIDAIIEYNLSSAPNEWFYGVHLDNEPYQLVGFSDPRQQEKIIEDFLIINEKAMKKIQDSGTGMVYGVDIPFWFDQPAFITSYKGKTKNLAEHLIDIMDNVGIMDYRDVAGGPDGIIAMGIDEIQYAAKAGKDVYIGVETFKYDPARIIFLVGLPKAEYFKRIRRTNLADKSRLDSFRLRTLDDNNNIHTGIVLSDEADTEAAKKMLMELAPEVSFDIKTVDEAVFEERLSDAEWALGSRADFEGFDTYILTDEASGKCYGVFETTEVMLDKITFAGSSKAYLEKQLKKTAAEFGKYESFYGFAIHYYKTYKELPDE